MRGAKCTRVCLRVLCGCLLRRTLLWGRTEGTSDPCVVPRGKRVGRAAEKSGEPWADIGVSARVSDEDCVVGIPGVLPPSVEDDLLPCVIRMEGGHDTPARLVEP